MIITTTWRPSIAGQLEKHVLKPMLAIPTTYMETRLKILVTSSCMIDFFCKSMAVSNFCDERKSATRLRRIKSNFKIATFTQNSSLLQRVKCNQQLTFAIFVPKEAGKSQTVENRERTVEKLKRLQ